MTAGACTIQQRVRAGEHHVITFDVANTYWDSRSMVATSAAASATVAACCELTPSAAASACTQYTAGLISSRKYMRCWPHVKLSYATQALLQTVCCTAAFESKLTA
jgi:hypothetical protein